MFVIYLVFSGALGPVLCKKGGEDEFKIECQKDGEFTDPKVCEPVQCGAAPEIPKAGIGPEPIIGP